MVANTRVAVWVLLAALSQTGCVVTTITVGSLDGASPIYHIDVNAPECAWLSSDVDGHPCLNLAVRDSVRIRQPFVSLPLYDNWRCEPNGGVIARYRLDTGDTVIPIETVEPWNGTLPVGIATVPVFHRSATAVGPSYSSELLGLALNGAAHDSVPREAPALVVWDEGGVAFSLGHGPRCCWLTPFYVRNGGRAVGIGTTHEATSIAARIGQIGLLPITVALDIALLPVSVPVFGIMLLLSPPVFI